MKKAFVFDTENNRESMFHDRGNRISSTNDDTRKQYTCSNKSNVISKTISFYLRESSVYALSSSYHESGAQTDPVQHGHNNEHATENEGEQGRPHRTQFEKFREYVEAKRQETAKRFEYFKRSTPNHETVQNRSGQFAKWRRETDEQEPFLERTKQSYEKYRRYAQNRLASQTKKTEQKIARRQQQEVNNQRWSRQRQRQHSEQRSNVTLLLLVLVLLVVVAISIVQLVV